MTSVLRSAPAAPMLTSFTIQATLSPLTDQQAGKYPLGPAPPISRRSRIPPRRNGTESIRRPAERAGPAIVTTLAAMMLPEAHRHSQDQSFFKASLPSVLAIRTRVECGRNLLG